MLALMPSFCARGAPMPAMRLFQMLDEHIEEFDADGNGGLDRDELRYWLAHPRPHVEVTLRIGDPTGDGDPVTVQASPESDRLTTDNR